MTRKFALIIGNSFYQDSALARLKTPDADVHALATSLRDPAIGGFDEVQELLNESEATVRRAISGFFDGKKPDDLLLMYFSGHGVLDTQGRLFLAVRDTQRQLLRATSIPAAFITDDMDSSRSKRQVLILDCCHSGAFARGTKGEATAITRNTFEGNGYGRIVLTASDSTQYALEGDQADETVSFSLFTNYLLEGLRNGEADRGGDGWIAVDEWYDYAYERVLNQTPNQTPKKWEYNTQGELVIARNPKPRPVKPVELPPYLLTALHSELPRVRLEAVEQLEGLLLGPVAELSASAALELRRMLDQDDSYTVRSRAAAILEKLPPREPISSEPEPRVEEHRTVQVMPAPEVGEAVQPAEEKIVVVETPKSTDGLFQRLGWPMFVVGLGWAMGWAVVIPLSNPDDKSMTLWSILIPALFMAGSVALSLKAGGLPIPDRSLGVLFSLLWVTQAITLYILSSKYYETSLGWMILKYSSQLLFFAVIAWFLQRYIPALDWKLILAGWVVGFAAGLLAANAIGFAVDPDTQPFIDPYNDYIASQLGLGGFVAGALGAGWMYRQIWNQSKSRLG